MHEQQSFQFADRELLAKLVALLPPVIVHIREGTGPPCPFVHYLAAEMIERALCEGWTIDRTNADGSLETWDGWLQIDTPGETTFLQIASAGGGKLV